MVRSPFPDFVGFAVVTTETCYYSLKPEEAALLGPRAVEKRRREFTLGRAACHAALVNCGLPTPPPILKGKHNEPLWPDGFIGAVSHAAGIAVCAVCAREKTAGIGIDLEEIPQDIDRNTTALVCTPAEADWVDEDPTRFTMIFSAKEAAFKAFFPTAPGFHDFLDATLVWDATHMRFLGSLLKEIGVCYPARYRFEVGSHQSGDLILSHILLSVR